MMADTTVQEAPPSGVWSYPPPQWLVQDGEGVTATVGAWSHRQAYHKGYRLLTEYLSAKAGAARAPAAPIAVTPI